LGFGVIFRGSVFWDFGWFSVVPAFRDSVIPAFGVAPMMKEVYGVFFVLENSSRKISELIG